VLSIAAIYNHTDCRQTKPRGMRRVVILGPGAPGKVKSTVVIRLSEIMGLPEIELDTLFWRLGLAEENG
jgi:hypothetical protein